ncbi:hypothetical protein AB0I51_29590 [Streptomyces sp. NPDC050549]|uniref:hypothetical protein n=1 Tax=Streptomyces sp. NPDC050549 TaxID=3155406 RepID=UPI0034394A4E
MPPHRTPGHATPADPYDMVLCAEELRDALAAHGITLPSLRADLPSFAGATGGSAGLVALGNCNLDTARRLAAVLREAAGR